MVGNTLREIRERIDALRADDGWRLAVTAGAATPTGLVSVAVDGAA